jgi:hypothetical protein
MLSQGARAYPLLLSGTGGDLFIKRWL